MYQERFQYLVILQLLMLVYFCNLQTVSKQCITNSTSCPVQNNGCLKKIFPQSEIKIAGHWVRLKGACLIEGHLLVKSFEGKCNWPLKW